MPIKLARRLTINIAELTGAMAIFAVVGGKMPRMRGCRIICQMLKIFFTSIENF